MMGRTTAVTRHTAIVMRQSMVFWMDRHRRMNVGMDRMVGCVTKDTALATLIAPGDISP